MEELEEAFLTFELVKREIGEQLLRRKSSGPGFGGVFASSNFMEDAKY